MVESLFSQLKARGEEFFTEVSNNLMANEQFIDLLKKGIAAKEEIDKKVSEAMKTMNVATRSEVARLERRLAEMESRMEEMKAAAAAHAPKPRSRVAKPARKKR